MKPGMLTAAILAIAIIPTTVFAQDAGPGGGSGGGGGGAGGSGSTCQADPNPTARPPSPSTIYTAFHLHDLCLLNKNTPVLTIEGPSPGLEPWKGSYPSDEASAPSPVYWKNSLLIE